MDWVERLAEEKIRRAIKDGVFRRSRYRGRKVPLEPENPHLPREWWAAFHILEIHDLAPLWILRGKWLRQAIAAWRRELAQAVAHPFSGSQRQARLRVLRRRLHVLNRHIREYNLCIPRSAVPMRPLDWDEELRKAGTGFQSGTD